MRNTYRTFIFHCLFALLGLAQAQAQTNFRPGYVLPLAGDTLRGEVDSRDGRASAFLARAELGNGFSNAIEAGATVVRFYGLVSYDLTKAPGPGSH